MKKVLNISLWTTLAVLVLVALGFVNKEVATVSVSSNDVLVDVDYESENRFVLDDDVKREIISLSDSGSKSVLDYNVLEIEKKINSNPAIKDAQVYKTIDGKIIVDVKQRKPIARIFTKTGSYYIDENGELMPLSNHYTARLVVFSGEINEPFASRYKFSYDVMPDSLSSKTILDDIFKLSSYINKSEFWKAQIEQVHVNKQLEFELIPKVGNHKIVMGGVDHLENKFDRLMVFYKKGLSKTGWNEYSAINLKYKNQIVCTKIYN